MSLQNEQQIQLQNPVAEHFDAFIFGNATMCDRVAQADTAKGQHIVVCGAGPSLADHAAEWCRKGDQVWGCNSALTYLYDNGHKVTHGVTVDQTAHMVAEWLPAPDVEYLLASTVCPTLTEHLLDRGRNLTFFHNFVGINKPPVAYGVCRVCEKIHNDTGINDCECGGMVRQGVMPYEDWLYASLYPATFRAGSGLNTVTRAIDLALFMGASRISVLGADCALRIRSLPPEAPIGSPEHNAWLRTQTVMHADGGHALASEATAVTMDGEIDGRRWVTKPDMVISAQWLVHMAKKHGRRIKLVGDTLPNALMHKDKKFLDRLPQLTGTDGSPLRFF